MDIQSPTVCSARSYRLQFRIVYPLLWRSPRPKIRSRKNRTRRRELETIRRLLVRRRNEEFAGQFDSSWLGWYSYRRRGEFRMLAKRSDTNSNIIDVDAAACNYGSDSFNGTVLRMAGYANDMHIAFQSRRARDTSRETKKPGPYEIYVHYAPRFGNVWLLGNRLDFPGKLPRRDGY